MIPVHRLAAFDDDRRGGNPAGVVVTDDPLPDEQMRAIAAEVGFSETAFLVPVTDRIYDVRYFAPEAEVPFCGHATIAAGVHLAHGTGGGGYLFRTVSGDVEVVVADGPAGRPVATLTSVEPSVVATEAAILTSPLSAFSLAPDDLDPAFAPATAFAGAWHVILVLAERPRLASMAYDFDAVRDLMEAHDLTTIALLWRERADLWHARNAFAVGGVVEDPATGAAAAAFGAYLRAGGYLLQLPASIVILQGEDMGVPSRLHVAIPSEGGIAVSGTATEM